NVARTRWGSSSVSSHPLTATVISETGVIGGTGPSASSRGHPVEDRPLHAVDGDPFLGHRVAVANRGGAVLERLDVDGHAPRCPDLVLAPVQLADGRSRRSLGAS